MSDKKLISRIFVFSQFALAFIVISSSLMENFLTERPPIAILKIISIAFLVLGIVIVLVALFTFRQSITPNPIPLDTARLRTKGIYGLIRHPMYSSVIFFLIGFSLFEKAYFSFLLNIGAIIFLTIKIKFEEKQLIEKFPEYKIYQSKTKKLIPFIY